MITTSAREIVAALKNVIPFASADVDDPAYNVVRIDFDGDSLYTSASNRTQHVRYRLDIEEIGDHEEAGAHAWQYGISAEAYPFSVRLDLISAKGVVGALAMNPAKLMFAPVTLKVITDMSERNMYKVKFIRDANDPLWNAAAAHYSGRGVPDTDEGDAPEVDIFDLIDRTREMAGKNFGVAWNAKLLANFSKVVAYGPLEMSFTGDAEQAVRVQIGTRFEGVAWPAKLDRPAPME